MRLGVIALLAVSSALLPAPTHGQSSDPGPRLDALPRWTWAAAASESASLAPASFASGSVRSARGPGAAVAGPETVPTAPATRTWAAPVASALLPGVGQLMQGRRRGWVYLATEAAVWVGYGVQRSRGRADRRAYRDLAWEVARAGTPGARMDGDFEYYERLSQWIRSGAFDSDPAAPGVQPEEDPSTFNGNAWLLAGAIFGGGGAPMPGEPGYEAALEFYGERAYGEAFLWDWTGAPGEQERFAALIDSSDTRLGRASLLAGAALVNHLASALDALLTYRGMAGSLRMRHRGLVPGRGPRPVLHFRLILP